MLQTLTRTGHPLATAHDTCRRWNLRCGARGLCQACRVTLIQGTYNIAGNIVKVGAFPTAANACQTTLLSATGIVDIPESALLPATGAIATQWQAAALPPMPAQQSVIAIDIGTTTLAAARIADSSVVQTATAMNPQAVYGDNIISRIAHAATQEGRRQLHATIVQPLDQLISSLCQHDEAPARLAIAGNTVMTSLLWQVDPTPIGQSPFQPLCRHFPQTTAHELGLTSLPPETPVLAVPAISGFIGGDLTAGLYETSLKPGELLLDLGTNCEIILNAGEQLLATAAAAGPAFEGSAIQAGRRATPGAIDHLHDDFTFSTIGNAPANGLCGSAMVDLLAAATRQHWLDKFGLPRPQYLGTHAANAADGTPAISITQDIVVTAEDIEQLLKAKAAIRAGILALLDAAQLREHHLRHLYLAGGFANFLQLDNARAIGMLPPDVPCSIVGNTALAGAARLACAPQHGETLAQLADLPREIPLNTIPSFEEHYIQQLQLHA